MNRDERNSQVRALVLSRLLPPHAIKWLFSSFSLLLFSIIGLGFSFHLEWMDKSLFLVLLSTVTIVVCMNTIIGGIFLFHHKNPYLNEWKSKLGYHEK